MGSRKYLRRFILAQKIFFVSLVKSFIRLLKKARIFEPLKTVVENARIRWSKTRKLEPRSEGKPSIMILADVRGWAWDYKAQQIKSYLSDEFNIDILYWSDFRWGHFGHFLRHCGYDLYFTFECNFIPYLEGVDFRKVITGVTSHTYVNFENYRRSLRNAYAVHANSRLLYEEISKINGNCFYVPNGVEESHFAFHPRDTRAEFTAGYVGKKIRRKGFVEFIVPACEKAGVRLKSLTSKYNHPDKISREEMPVFYYDIDVVLIASDMDGTPNQLLEAASVGRTFIANRIGNVPEFYSGRNGFFVEREIGSYVEKILWLKNNRETCAAMGLEARKTVEHGWTWKERSGNYREMFRKVLRGEPCSG